MPQAKDTIKSNTINLQNTVLWIQIELAKAYTLRAAILSYHRKYTLLLAFSFTYMWFMLDKKLSTSELLRK